MSKDVVVKNENELIAGKLDAAGLSAMVSIDPKFMEGVSLDITENQDVFSNDIVVPKLQLVQAMSAARKDKLAEEGDYINSKSEDVLLEADADSYLSIIPMATFKRWHTYKLVPGGKKEFVSSVIMKAGENLDWKYEETIDGEDYVRSQVISAYVLLGEEAQKGVIKPFIVDFKATSKGAGRNLVSDIRVLNAGGNPGWITWFKLSKKEDSNDDGEFFVKTIKFGGYIPEAMHEFLFEAYKDIKTMIDNNTIEIDDRDVHDSAKEEIQRGSVEGGNDNV